MEKVSYENPFTGGKGKKPDLLEALKEKYGDIIREKRTKEVLTAYENPTKSKEIG